MAPTNSGIKKRIRLLLADDHPVVRKGIAACLARHSHLEIVGEAQDGQETLELARKLVPDLLLMDLDMPRVTGLVVADQLHKELPQIKVLVLSMHSQAEFVVRIIQSGAQGYVLKDASPEELVHAIETVNAGDTFFSPDVARVALHQFMHDAGGGRKAWHITRREEEVLIQIAEGFSNKEIAGKLGVGIRTIETHRERIMRKLNIHNVAGLTKFAIANGLITLPDDTKPGTPGPRLQA
jgi:two-component system nitrate/nitrite response regulator NarL